MMPVEIGVLSYRVNHFDSSPNVEHLGLKLDLVEELCEGFEPKMQPSGAKSSGTIMHE